MPILAARAVAAAVLLLSLLVPASLGRAADGVAATEDERLAAAVERYAAIAARGGWRAVAAGTVLEAGMTDAHVADLRRRLRIEGDLEPDNDGALFDAALARAVRRFQSRHGLLVDGRVGPETLDALNLPADARLAQLRLNVERARRLPGRGTTYVRVNAASALLDVMENGRSILRMPVIVGDTRHPTPEFEAPITGVIFNPPWTVPRSITIREILPRLRREPGYLAANDIRIVERPDDPHGLGVNWRAAAASRFGFTLRQSPGPHNALGLIKFDMPNRYDVYLHDTPNKRLFERPTRAFSHGCIRVSRPRELAAYALGPEWTKAQIDAAIAAGETRRVNLESPLTVRVTYLTAFADPDGTVQFRRDIFGRDATTAARMPATDPAGCGK